MKTTKKTTKKKAAAKKPVVKKKTAGNLPATKPKCAGGTSVNTVEDAFDYFGYDRNALPVVNMLPARFQKYIVNHYEMTVVIAAINCDKEPDWNNSQELKWVPWPDVITKKNGKTSSSGFGLSITRYTYARTHAHVGSRQTFRTKEGARHFFEKFYSHYVTNQLFPQS